MLFAQPGQGRVFFDQGMGPFAEGLTVEGVPKTGHALFVAVIDGRHAGQAPDQGGQQQLQTGSPAVGYVVVLYGRLLFPGEALPVPAQGQNRADPGHVVGGEQVHQTVIERRRIVQPLPQQELGQLPAVKVPQSKIQQGLAQGVIHHRIQGPAQRVGAVLIVADLAHRVLPHLADDGRLRVLGFDLPPDLLQDRVGQFVRHVQPPAGSAGPQPTFDHGIIGLQHEILPGRVLLVHLGQGGEIPPAAVAVGIAGVEIVPGAVGRIRMPVAPAAVAVVDIEIAAVRPGMGKDAVQDDADAMLAAGPAQAGKGRLVPQHRVHAAVIRRIVAVVGGRLEDGVEVEHADAQGSQIIHPFPDGVQSAAEEVQRLIVLGLIAPAFPVRLVQPVFMEIELPAQSAVIFQPGCHSLLVSFGEAVREYLVHDPLPQPLRGGEGGIVHGQAEAGRLRARGVERAHAAPSVPVRAVDPALIRAVQVKTVGIGAYGFRRNERDLPGFVLPGHFVAGLRGPQHLQADGKRRLRLSAGAAQGQRYRRAGRYRPDGAAVFRPGWIVKNNRLHVISNARSFRCTRRWCGRS